MEATGWDLEKGMDVYADDGEKVGSIEEVWAAGEAQIPVERSTTELSDYGPIGGTSHELTTKSGYMRITSGGVLGVGQKELYIPFSEVTSASREGGVVINCDLATCEERYLHKPDLFEAEN